VLRGATVAAAAENFRSPTPHVREMSAFRERI